MSGNENTIDIMILIDVATILDYSKQGILPTQLSMDPSKPTPLYNYLLPGTQTNVSSQVICMYTARSNVSPGSNSEGSDELSVTMKQGDNVYWRTTTLSKDMIYAAVLYDYEQTAPNPKVDTTVYLKNIDASVLSDTPMPVINNHNPPASYHDQPIPQKVTTYYWSAQAVNKCNNLRYNWSFMLVGPDNGTLGYCSWDPYFIIT
ncbi:MULTISPECIES: AidA/PixA family protein [Pseudomonas]|uniref:Inclusion body family protein n=1 Tax=Pseudomonas sessilinigenes TaxID=658629 RepID=A0ABX8MXT0_9PSED|nr:MULTISPECIES: AidA/PixA family protein [Pseudomonas]AZC24361.1 hypothetical protein C4K39_2687 [Pseudomonas sessilinigenes]QIH08478.1 hypothetical protein ATY02_18005 [Pseudomonas sp. BIOMIG1BAC]QXH43305.1 inclusion body family protein [Pseudomonas sessilinigenes]